MAHVTLQELKDHTGVTDKQLQLQCSDEHLEQIAYKIGNWTSYAFILKLEEWQVQSVKVNLELDYLHKIMEVLKMWKKNNVHNATYLSLVRGCLKAGDGIVAGDVCQLAKSEWWCVCVCVWCVCMHAFVSRGVCVADFVCVRACVLCVCVCGCFCVRTCVCCVYVRERP